MLYLITGGAGSGKSEYAERLAEQLCEARLGQLFYAATMDAGMRDPDTQQRIAKHRMRRRGRGYCTIECPTEIARVEEMLRDLPKTLDRDVVLLEDLTNLYANEIYGTAGQPHAVLEPLRSLAQQVGALIVVANELYSDGICYPEETDRFLRDLAGLTAQLAAEAVQVTEVIYGLPLPLKEAAAAASQSMPEGTCCDQTAGGEMTKEGEHMKFIMVIGGAAQGKHRFAAGAWPAARILDDWDQSIRRQLSEGCDPRTEAAAALRRLREEAQDTVLIYPEVGCGVVPMEPAARVFREAVGRVGCLYAAAADEVYRVTAGIPLRLK